MRGVIYMHILGSRGHGIADLQNKYNAAICDDKTRNSLRCLHYITAQVSLNWEDSMFQ